MRMIDNKLRNRTDDGGFSVSVDKLKVFSESYPNMLVRDFEKYLRVGKLFVNISGSCEVLLRK